MCLMCVEYEKGKMTSREVLNAVGEMLDFSEDETEKAHLFGLVERVLDTEEDMILTDMPEIIGFDDLLSEEGDQ